MKRLVLTHSFEDLAQTLRVLIESHWKLSQLITVDRPEAVGTIETAINAVLNAFHSLYDLMRKDLSAPADWYAIPELCTILAVRNARHHNLANRIRSLYNYHSQESDNPTDSKKYLYIDFPAPPEEEGGDCFDVPISWGDIDEMISLPRNKSRLRDGTRELVISYLAADIFESEAANQGIAKDQIFINFVPLVLNAGIAVHPYVKDHIAPDSVEANHFNWHFENIGAAITERHEYEILDFVLPK